ncbi:collagen-like protein, partial [Streptomyces sp. A73]|nr:collagen-like protein [Streptomyces sp. A73]
MPVSVLVGNYEQTSRARDDIADLAKQVEQLGEKPVAGPPGSRGDPDEAKPGPRGPRGPAGETGD